MSTDRIALAIDPGRSKCGLAGVRCDGVVVFREIVATPGLVDRVVALAAELPASVLVVGAGTGAKGLMAPLANAVQALPIVKVDEWRTSEEARARYVAENPARGLRRLLPGSLRVPERPYDDYAAAILGERYWERVKAGRTSLETGA